MEEPEVFVTQVAYDAGCILVGIGSYENQSIGIHVVQHEPRLESVMALSVVFLNTISGSWGVSPSIFKIKAMKEYTVNRIKTY